MSPKLVTICKTWLVCGMSVAVKSAPVGSLLLDVVTLKLGVPVFALLKATRTGEPIAMLRRRGDHGKAAGAPPRATNTVTVRAVADRIGERHRERLRSARVDWTWASTGEGIRRRIERHAGGQRRTRRRW